jgi:tetraacyldisaccharide 4'-kinase
VLPVGDLREPTAALNRAHGFIITGVSPDNSKRVQVFQQFLNQRFPDKPIFTALYQPATVLKKGLAQAVTTIPAAEAAGMMLYGFCGIANPASFKQLLVQEQYNLVGFKAYRDHHAYSKRDLHELGKLARKAGAQALIATEKDFVKLKSLFLPDIPILSLAIEPALDQSFDEFLNSLL